MATRKPRRRRGQGRFGGLLVVAVLLIIGYYLLRELEDGELGNAVPPTAAPPATAVQTGQPSQDPRPRERPWYQVFFTTPRYPDRPEYHTGGIDEHLVAFIGSATQTIDVADYDFDLENVARALAEAAARGVRVRMVTDDDTLINDDPKIQQAFAILKQAGIPVVDDGRSSLMHNKFVVVDNAAVWTGSWNFTEGDTYRLNNNAIRIDSPQLAQNYAVEFEQMFAARRFGTDKLASTPHLTLTIDGTRVENYFSPRDRVSDRVITRLLQAQQSIHFMAFSFTSKSIGGAVIDRARAGVEVQGVFETTGSNTDSSMFGPMKREGLEVLQDGNPYVMHHKVFIIDGRTVIFGSFNFSNNAETSNDENLLIVDDPALAEAFEAEFQRVREQALDPPARG